MPNVTIHSFIYLYNYFILIKFIFIVPSSNLSIDVNKVSLWSIFLAKDRLTTYVEGIVYYTFDIKTLYNERRYATDILYVLKKEADLQTNEPRNNSQPLLYEESDLSKLMQEVLCPILASIFKCSIEF